MCLGRYRSNFLKLPFLHGLHPIGISEMNKNAYSDLKWSNEDNEIFSIEQREQYDLVDGGKL